MRRAEDRSQRRFGDSIIGKSDGLVQGSCRGAVRPGFAKFLLVALVRGGRSAAKRFTELTPDTAVKVMQFSTCVNARRRPNPDLERCLPAFAGVHTRRRNDLRRAPRASGVDKTEFPRNISPDRLIRGRQPVVPFWWSGVRCPQVRPHQPGSRGAWTPPFGHYDPEAGSQKPAGLPVGHSHRSAIAARGVVEPGSPKITAVKRRHKGASFRQARRSAS